MAIGADLIASTMNCNLGGRNQGATEVERAVVEFAVEVSGLPKEHAFGILTSGKRVWDCVGSTLIHVLMYSL